MSNAHHRARPWTPRTATVLTAALALLATPLAPGTSAAEEPTVAGVGDERAYEAEIRRTEFGIPHVLADDLGSVAFGAAYAFAQDNVCVFAEEVVTARAERSITFDGSAADLDSDLFHARLTAGDRLDALLGGERGPAPSTEARELVSGYAAGYNHFLDAEGDDITDPACAGEDWVRPIDERDLWTIFHVSLMRAGESAVMGAIANAQPPASGSADAAAAADDVDRSQLAERLRELPGGHGDGGPVGSNAYALGAEATEDGTGMVLGNPHFPWRGPERFYRQHLTVPGDLDVTGASLFGVPLVNIGHNQHVAWSHTVSTADRFTLHLLELDEDDPTAYVVDGETRQMERTEVTVEVPDGEGGVEEVTRTLYESHLGPVLDLLPWGTFDSALVMRDANASNARAMDSWLGMNRAGSVDELLGALDETQGIPWVNTIAADDQGTAAYADHSVVPNLSDEHRAACREDLVSDLAGLDVLDGSDSSCDPPDDPEAAAPGILAPDDLPVLTRDDYATNMNNSYWLANPEQPLEGFHSIIGSEGTDIGLRARLGLRMVQERLVGEDGLDGTGFTLERLQDVMFNNRNLAAELVRDDLVTACRDAGEEVVLDGETVDLAEACDVLADWDLRVELTSRGAHVFREFRRFGGVRFAEAFDVDDPVNTPRMLDVEDDRVLEALGRAVQRLEGAGVPLDAELGELQSVTRDDVRTPIHGGPGGEGIFNVISAPWSAEAGGYPDVVAGASFIMTVELTEDGPVSEAILSYSQSTDPTSEHYADQEPRYSAKDWIPMRFGEDAIAEGLISSTTVSAEAPPVPDDDPPDDDPPGEDPPGEDPPGEDPVHFPDVPADSVHAAAIARLVERGVLHGFPDGTFRPHASITRAQTASVLMRALGLAPVGDGPFSDVTGSGGHAGAINAVAAAGLVEGFDDGTFRPGRHLTRAQLASTLARALDLEPVADGPFTDIAGSTHEGAINALAAAGIARGKEDGTFRPGTDVSRAQAASLVDRALFDG